jgi:hypothetical protein
LAARPVKHGILSNPPAAILIATISEFVIAGLDACPGTVTSRTAGCRAVGAHAAIALRDNNSSAFNFEPTGVAIRKRYATHREYHDGCADDFHVESSLRWASLHKEVASNRLNHHSLSGNKPCCVCGRTDLSGSANHSGFIFCSIAMDWRPVQNRSLCRPAPARGK